jgi:hypothetical protein
VGDGFALDGDGVADLGEFACDEVGVGAGGVLVEFDEGAEGDVGLGMLEVPARGFGEEEDPDCEEEGGEDLEREGKTPSEVSAAAGAAVADPLLEWMH